MKKFLFLFVCLAGFAVASNAQCTKGTAAAGCSKSTAATCHGSASTAAVSPEVLERALAADKTVSKKVCADGSVCYVRTVSNNGAQAVEAVTYDASAGKFVLAPATATAGAPAGCSKAAGAACCSKPGAATEAAPSKAPRAARRAAVRS